MNKGRRPPFNYRQLDSGVCLYYGIGVVEAAPQLQSTQIANFNGCSRKNWPKASSKKVRRTSAHVPEFEYGCKGAGGLF